MQAKKRFLTRLKKMKKLILIIAIVFSGMLMQVQEFVANKYICKNNR